MKTKLLTVREYAKRQGITMQTAYRRIWDGRVSARRIYGRWLISPAQSSEKRQIADTKPQAGDLVGVPELTLPPDMKPNEKGGGERH